MDFLFSALVSLGLTLTPAQASQTWVSTCFPADSAATLLAWVRGVATNTDEAAAQQRSMMRLSLVSESAVAYVTDERICRGVLGEYNKYSGTREATTGVESPPSGQVCVIQVGAVYLVTDPSKTFGEFLIWVTTDTTFRMLAHALG